MFATRRSKITMGTLMAAMAFAAFTGPEAFASSPGEGGTWQAEKVSGSQQLRASGTVREARSGDNVLMTSWTGVGDGGVVWYSVNNGTPQTVLNPDGSRPIARSGTAPALAPWGSHGFVLAYTATDGSIRYTFTADDGAHWDSWESVPGQSTQQNVSVAQVGGPNSAQIMMVYHGFGSDDRWWATFFDGLNWHTAQDTGGRGPSAPTVAWIQPTNQIAVFGRGEDNSEWYSVQDYGQSPWAGWRSLGGQNFDQPGVAVDENTGNIQIAVRAGDNHIWYEELNRDFTVFQVWTPDITGWQTNFAPNLTWNPNNGDTNILFTGQDSGNVYWKQSSDR